MCCCVHTDMLVHIHNIIKSPGTIYYTCYLSYILESKSQIETTTPRMRDRAEPISYTQNISFPNFSKCLIFNLNLFLCFIYYFAIIPWLYCTNNSRIILLFWLYLYPTREWPARRLLAYTLEILQLAYHVMWIMWSMERTIMTA